MELEERADVFINVHKGLRRGLAGLALDLGQVDWEDDSEVKTLDKKFSDMLHFLREHVANEDEVQFPMLEARVPGAADREREEHREQETKLDGMERDWNGMTPAPLSNPDLPRAVDHQPWIVVISPAPWP